MVNYILNNFKNLDTLAKKIMKYGIRFCSSLGIIALIILVTYSLFFTNSFLYFIGFTLFKLSLIFGVEFIICGFVADKIKKQLI